MIHHLPNKFKWPHVEAEEILPPKAQRALGRPKTCKRMEIEAHKRLFTVCCKFCGVITIIEDVVLLIQPIYTRKQGTCW